MGARIKLMPANNVVPSGVATIDLSNLIGFTIERLILQLGGGAFTKAMITMIQLKQNGKIIWDTTGTRRDTAMLYRGISANASFLTLDFSEIRSKTELGQNIGSNDTTLGVSNLKLEITISGATTPTISGFAETNRPQIDPAQQNTRALIAKIHSTTVSIGAAGTFSLPVPHLSPQDGGSLFKRILFFSANMTALVIKKNGIVIEDSTKAMNDFNQAEYRKVPQASLYVFDPIVDDCMSQILNTRDATTMEVLATFSGAETITIESELLEPLGAF